MPPSTSWSGRFSIFEFRNLCAITEVNPYGFRRVPHRDATPSEKRLRSTTLDVRGPSTRNARAIGEMMLAEAD